MSFCIVYTPSYNKRAAKFLKKHPELYSQYEKTLKLLEIDPGFKLAITESPTFREPFAAAQRPEIVDNTAPEIQLTDMPAPLSGSILIFKAIY